jgi:hypothetical protein
MSDAFFISISYKGDMEKTQLALQTLRDRCMKCKIHGNCRKERTGHRMSCIIGICL